MTTTAALDATLVNSLIKATTDVLSMMTQTEVNVKEVKPQADYHASGDLSALIGITGTGGEGMVALSFPLNLSTLLVSRLLGVNADSITSEDRCDGIGELVNMISGNAKTTIASESGNTYKLSLPSIIQGKGHEVSTRPKGAPYIVIVFEAEKQEFQLQVTFKFT
ncbi:MAG: chemotaxis protein CheX [Candidatus Melainabacteria bacterium]